MSQYDKTKSEEFKNQGNKCFSDHHYIPAVAFYDQAIEACPPEEKSLLAILYGNRAFANMKMENFGLTIQDVEKALAADPKYVKGYYRRAEANAILQKFAEAMADYKKIVELTPNDKVARKRFQECKASLDQQRFFAAISSPDAKPAESDVDIEGMEVGSEYLGPHLVDGKVTEKFMQEMVEHFKNEKKIHKKYAYQILVAAKNFFKTQSTLVDIPLEEDGKISVCGDTHGQYYDLLNLFTINGFPSETNRYLFNGDFVDRGSFSCEVLFVLLGYKLLYPNHFFLSRGNHETVAMNKMYGFSGEINAKYSSVAYEICRELFCLLPLCHVIGGKIFVVHGGLSTLPNITLDTIRKIDRNREPPESGGLMSDLLWADPQVQEGKSPSKRGVGFAFGPNYTNQFLQENGLELVIRSHEVKAKGYQIEHGGKLITVFSAPNYCDQVGNQGAWVAVKRVGNTDKYEHKCHSFSHVPHPQVPPMAYC